jgi:hypothetical protein
LPWHEEGCKTILEELHSRRELPHSGLGDLYRTSVHDLTKVYASKASLATYNEHFARRASQAFAFCYSMGGPASLQIAVERALAGSADPTKHQDDDLAAHRLSTSEEPFAPMITQTVLTWTRNVLGPRPSKTAPVSTIGAILARSYACRCTECSRVKDFLRSSSPILDLSFIGAPKRTHVEKEVSSHIRDLVTHQKIDSRPQGLLVRIPRHIRLSG